MLLQMKVFLYIYIYFFFWLGKILLYIESTPHHLRPTVDGYLCCLHVLAIVNCVAINTAMHASFQMSFFIFSEYLPIRRIAGLYGRLFSDFKVPPYCSPQS